ncbi:MAG TPA: FlgO family outer membrane protein [Nitrospirota bacterium]|nr:FlgO family outer membrane protein [Nitrospirota bacterium]
MQRNPALNTSHRSAACTPRFHRLFLLAFCIACWMLTAPGLSSAADVSINDAVKKFVDANKRMRVAVFDFANTSGAKTRFDAFIADTIVSELSKYPVTLLERKRLETLLGEQALSQTGVVDATKALKLGTLLPVDVVVSGSYTEMGNKLVINGRFIHVVTGEILSAFTSELTVAPAPAATKEDKESLCRKNQEIVRKALYNLQDQAAVRQAVDIVLTIPFDNDCGRVHYDVLYTFSRHKISDERYSAFLLNTIRSLDTPSDDDRANEILRFFAADGAVDNTEWQAGIETLKKMRGYALHLPLRPLLNSEHEKSSVLRARIDEIMRLTAEDKIGRPVPVKSDVMLYGIMSALQINNEKQSKADAIAVFRKYAGLIPDDDAGNKKAVEILRSLYFNENDRKTSSEALALMIEVLKQRTPSESLAESVADIIKSMESKSEDQYEREGEKRERYRADLKVVNPALSGLYCRSVGVAKKKGYHYIVEERTLHILKNRMTCEFTPGIKDLENEMRSGDWDRKVKAVELLSKSGDAAKDAEKTVIKYLGQQGFGSQGGMLRRFCAQTLGNIRTTDPEGITRLIESFPDYNDGVSYEAEEAIRKIGMDALPYLIKGLGSNEHATRLRCAKALGNLGAKAKAALPELKRLAASDTDPYVKKEANAAVQVISNDY